MKKQIKDTARAKIGSHADAEINRLFTACGAVWKLTAEQFEQARKRGHYLNSENAS